MKVLEVFNSQRVMLELEAKNKKDVITRMAQVLLEQGVISDKNAYVKSVLERDEHSTTGVGNAIAIPHGKSEVVNEPAIIFAKLHHEVEWNALDNKPVKIVVMLAIPNIAKGKVHLALLSEVAVKLMDDQLVNKLKEAKTEKCVVELLS
ncbi:PTS sugar transporter subunit IIA [Pediococcus pentosaceus]|jgi:PTS system fructose-specific IIA component|uniref:PTS sugar transporter subunit IIA n=1 Tax=Pediococcus pentosaceus TaxID=1255 RepID=UPI00070491EF|nr:fructose PTS transporter subunit IIA [Pediococcus pentosaceus]MCE5960152.1 fructose PTS transporter subunit IIA [Pediococcus pentosaceus]MCG7197115.1 fructose PTS transporter subunit IIA [Pediococcus pentosaceus]MCI2396486.1 fructose PTS transporter subunit IIA [Pediococcus pentosaceus]MCS8563637.1 PTS mannose transporter subunit IIAB [Pediococcus pentosaceus]MCS8567400.1 PTS mannose transporter subunit IIAB [Pediococcus pentosaceus]